MINVSMTGPAAQVEMRKDRIEAWLGRIGLKTIAVMQQGMARSRGGRTYRRRGRYHVASAPGNYPAVDTGALRSSLMVAKRSMEIEIGTNIAYAKWLAPADEGDEGRGPKRLMFRAGVNQAATQTHAPPDFVRWVGL